MFFSPPSLCPSVVVPVFEEHPDIPQGVPWQVWPAQQRAVWPFWPLWRPGLRQGECKLYTCGWMIYFSASKKALYLNWHCDELKEWCCPEAIILTTAGAMRHDAACITDNIICSRSSVLLLSDGNLWFGGWNSYDQMSWYTAVYDSYQWHAMLLNQIFLNSPITHKAPGYVCWSTFAHTTS